MTGALQPALHWVGIGLKESAAMVWMTWWPLVLGFTLSGVVQSFLPRDGLRARLGRTTPATVAEASLLGVISSSCSYAASAMARALFARGASWPNALVFMVASTNLVIELGIVMYLLLGGPFVAAQLVGGAIMVAGLGVLTPVLFSGPVQARLRERVLADAPPPATASATPWRTRVRDAASYRRAARYTLGDVTMLRKELVAGFLVAGFLTVHVPTSWWANIFVSGHGWLTIVENAVLAPLLAVISFVCSVGNIPLAAALWVRGVAFGGVISFIFADLVTLPLLLIYRRFYGTRAAVRLFALLWFVMSAGGLMVDGIFRAAHWIPTTRHVAAMSGQFPLGATLLLNVVAGVGLGALWLLGRSSRAEATVDPICGMSVDVTAPVATRTRDGVTYYFCSPRCAERFDRGDADEMREDPAGDAVDPVCSMTVNSATAPSALAPDGSPVYFCSEGCRSTYLGGADAPIHLGRKPS